MHESATFTYLDWQERYQWEKPFQIFSAVADNTLETTNLVFKDGPKEHVRDCRSERDQYRLDTHGFAFCEHEINVNHVTDAEQIETRYLPEMERLLRQNVDDVGRVYFFDWRIRKNVDIGTSIIDANDKMQHLHPARHVHIDQTPSAALGRILLHLPDDAESLLQGRVQIINLWRPLVHEVQERPLALCDIRSVSPSNLIEADHVRKHYNGSNCYLTADPRYKWHYLSDQKRCEVTLIQMFDSAKEGVSGCPHSSFDPTDIKPNAVKRESIEVRALVFSRS